jgi:single-strand DNA-binding protein
MLELNKVMLIGNLTRDPEPNEAGTVWKFGIAVNRSWKDKSGQWQKEASFFDVNAFGKIADFVGKYLKKGNRIYLEGELKQDSWQAQDGTKRTAVKINAMSIQFADSKPKDGESGDHAQPLANVAPPAPQPSVFDGGNTADDLPF